MLNLLVFIFAYLICSINPAIMLSKKVIGMDIRKVGSGNAGTTNAIRTMGKGWGALVFILDAFKVVVAYWVMLLTVKIFGGEIGPASKSFYLVGAILGHCYPVYYGFKGGKGVVAILISCSFIAPREALVCLIVGVIIIIISRMVSLGSVSAILLFDIMIVIMQPKYAIAVLIVSAVILYKHRANIKRIINKEENRLF